MTNDRNLRFRLQPIAMVMALLLAAALLQASRAQAAEPIGGLGRVDESVITPGTEGKPGQVNPSGVAHGHAFAVDPKTGDFFVADEFKTGSGNKVETFARLQEFSGGSKGAFVSEGRVKLHSLEGFSVERVGGLAVDSEAGKVDLLIDLERTSEGTVEEKIEEKEETLEKKKEALEKKPTEQLEEEIKELEDEISVLRARLPLFDSEQFAAAEVWSFTIGTLTQHKAIVDWTREKEEQKQGLMPDSETGKVPLLDPTGITVDPTTHDILISGQQDESPDTTQGREEGEEGWHTAIQRVHESGELGPRYIDGFGSSTVNCLDKGEESAEEEPLCVEDAEEFPNSPVATSGGRLFVYDYNEIWEVPASVNHEEAFAGAEAVSDIATKPKHLFTLSEFFGGVIREGEGGAMSYVPLEHSSKLGWREGRLYLDGDIGGNGGPSGLVEIDYAEPEVVGSEKPEAREVGWTGGQAHGSPQSNCVLASGSATPVLMAGGSGETIFALTTPESKFVEIWGYGLAGEACGAKPTVSSPNVEDGNGSNHLEPGSGEAVKFSSHMTGAQATEVTWLIKHVNPESGKTEEETIAPGYKIEASPFLEHDFSGSGEYEVTETVKTNSLGYPTIVAGTVKLEVTSISVKLGSIDSASAQEEVGIRAKLEDPAETPAHFKVTWNFGDGTQPLSTEYEGSPKEVEVKHSFAAPGNYEITVEATDKSGLRHASAKVPVQVEKSAAELQKIAEEAATTKAAEEAAAKEAAAKKAAEEAAAAKAAEEAAAKEAAAKKAAEEAAAKKAAEEAAAKKKHEEELARAKKPLTRAQLLAKALKQCKKEPKKKRSKCEATARKKYSSKKKKKK